MANFYRLIFLALVLLSSWLPASSFAATETIAATATAQSTRQVWNVNNLAYDNLPFACELFRAANYPSHTSISSVLNNGVGAYSNCYTLTGPYAGWFFVLYSINSCSPNGTAIGSVCTNYSCPINQGWALSGTSCTRTICGAGFVRDAFGVCLVDHVVACKTLVDGLNYVNVPLVHYGTVGLTACFGGYVINGSGGAGASIGSGVGQAELYGPYQCSGSSPALCDVIAKPGDITAICALGTFPGTVNGLQVCVPATSSSLAPKTTTSLPPVPGGVAPSIEGAPPGTVEQTVSTTCLNGSCTTVTTNKDATGASLGSFVEVESQPDFCADNPTAPGCVEPEEGSFSGTCGSPPSCDGDALLCAVAAQTFKTACALTSESSESALYDVEKLKTGSQTGGLPNNSSVTFSSSLFDTSNALSGSCIGDKTIVVMGSTVVLPFSSICPYLAMLGQLLVAVSMLLAGRIVIRG